MIAIGAYPFSIVEEPGFVELLTYAEPRYKLPHRTTFSRTHLPELYQQTKSSIIQSIESATFISCTSDIWSPNNEASFIISYFSKKLKYAVLGKYL